MDNDNKLPVEITFPFDPITGASMVVKKQVAVKPAQPKSHPSESVGQTTAPNQLRKELALKEKRKFDLRGFIKRLRKHR